MITVHMPDMPDRTLPAPSLPCSLLTLLRNAGLAVSAPCGGTGRCGKCRVRAIGDLSLPDAEEIALLGSSALQEGMRLACRSTVIGENLEIFLAPTADILPSDLPFETNETLPPLRPLGKTLGLAIDLGTTTVAGALYDLKNGICLAEKTCVNPQTAYGADVISRLQAARTQADRLADTAKAAIRQLCKELCAAAGTTQLPDAAVLTANTAMLCLLFGYPVRSLCRAPFSLPHAFGERLPLSALLPDAAGTLYVPPCIGPFLGADIVTAMLDTDLLSKKVPTALIDLGTNGEIALFDGTQLFCCSTAAGPALEGAGIRMGTAAVRGAIAHASAQSDSLCLHTVGNAPAIGICGSGLVDVIAALLDLRKIDTSGRLCQGDGQCIRLADSEVFLYQQDIRAVQSAKAAIRAGLETLCDAVSVRDPDLLLAGGFGSALDIGNAARIGLIPQSAAKNTRAVGNAALHGAAKLLMDTDLTAHCLHIVSYAEHMDLSIDPAFAERYVSEMSF